MISLNLTKQQLQKKWLIWLKSKFRIDYHPMCIYIFIIKSDLKNLTSAIASDIVADLNSLKDNIESNYKAYVG